MANRVFLSCCNGDVTYPSVRYRAYRPEVHALAEARDGVPLLWLALFGPGDVRRDTLEDEDGGEVRVLAPVTRRASALARLDRAAARLAKAYPQIGALEAHAEAFEQMLRAARGTFVTIELEERVLLSRSRATFDAQLMRALDYLAGGAGVRSSQTLTALSGVDPKRRLVPPKELFARPRPARADLLNCMRVLGTSHIREVPWEAVAARPPARATPSAGAPQLGRALHEALARGDEPLARELLARGANPNAVTPRALTMEYVVAGAVSLDMGRALVDAGFDLTRRRQGYTALQRAVGLDQLEAVRGQLALGASVDHEDGFGRSLLALAACRGALVCVDFFLGLGPDVRAISAAIRHAEKRIARPAVPSDAAELERAREAVARLRRALQERQGDASGVGVKTTSR